MKSDNIQCFHPPAHLGRVLGGNMKPSIISDRVRKPVRRAQTAAALLGTLVVNACGAPYSDSPSRSKGTSPQGIEAALALDKTDVLLEKH